MRSFYDACATVARVLSTRPARRGHHGPLGTPTMTSPRPSRLRLPLIVIAALLVAVAAWFAQRSTERPPDEAPSMEVRRAREKAAAFFAQDNRGAAWSELEPLVTRPDARAEDLVRAAIVRYSQGLAPEAIELLERALELDPDSAAAHYNRGQFAWAEGDGETAREHFERAFALAPDDVPTMLALSVALEEHDPERAEVLLRRVLDLGLDHAGSFYVAAVYRLLRLQQSQDRFDEADALAAEFQRLRERGFEPPSNDAMMRGNLGRLALPEPTGHGDVPPARIGPFGDPRTILPALGAARDFVVCDLNGDGEADVLAWDAAGVRAAFRGADGTWTVGTGFAEGVERALPFDVDNDADADLVLVRGGTVELALGTTAEVPDGAVAPVAWDAPAIPIASWDAPVRDVIAVDQDHDGDLDLALAGAFGAKLLRNDAAGTGGTFVDVSVEAGMPSGDLAWVVAEDFDTDQDVDLLFGGAETTVLASNARGGRFDDASELVAGLPATERTPFAHDLDGDGRPDLFWPIGDDGYEAWTARPSGRFESTQRRAAGLPDARLVDVDLNGLPDLVTFDAESRSLRGVRSAGTAAASPFDLALNRGDVAPTGPFWIGDLDADLALELVAATGEGFAVWDAEAPDVGAMLLSLRGVKDNSQGVGAIVELRAGAVYQRHFWHGCARLLGVGPVAELDWLRITWPNGVRQFDPRRDLGDRRVGSDPLLEFRQIEGLVGSCPFLYTWNGETYEFVSDVLGITPLGLPMAPGELVPPDHDESVLVTGEQLVPKQGFLELQFTEELREVTYLDRARLDVVDHPIGTEIFPDERFTFPPFPAPHTHTVEAPLAPLRATDGDGRDWTRELAAVDDVHAAPFEPAPSQYLGLATPHVLELGFDPERVRSATKLRLVLTGWFYWTDASVNVAVAGDPSWSFVPPILSVPDGEGGWRETGPPLGFPAGKTKTMVIDVTDLLVREDPRLRLFSTLRLYWDSIRLAVCGDDAELRVTSLEPVSAKLWRRGFSAPLADEDERDPHQPARFVWDELAERPRWNPHPGLYTKLGEVVPLVGAIDDRFVVMGTGEALTVRFDARELPPVPAGFRRDYLVFLDGWAKDRDPNTVEALYVEPLPFHDMSGYPYGEDEHFPDTPAHRAWRREWQTRVAEPWLATGPDDPLAGAPSR